MVTPEAVVFHRIGNLIMSPEQHNKYLGIAFIVHGAIQALFTLLMILFFAAMFSGVPGDPGSSPPPPMVFFGVFFGFILVIQLLFTTPAFVAAYALLKRKQWARIAAIVGGVVSAMSVPVGTAVCVYALWFLLSDAGKQFYEAAQRAPASPYGLNELRGGQATEWARWAPASESEETRVRPPQPTDWR